MSQPNIVLIMTDQQRADFSKAEGYALDPMPFLDALGRRGARFSRAYTPMPTCAPARCAMFSGRFPKATRVRENSGIKNIFRTKDLAETLREKGYSINITGKNHSYLKPEDFDYCSLYNHHGQRRPAETCTPQEREMDEWLGSLDHGISLEPTPFPLECQPPYRVARDAIQCVDAQGERPFFLWMSFAEPHNPYQVCEPYFSMFPEDHIPERAAGPESAKRKGAKWRWERDLIESKRPGFDKNWRRYRADYLGMIRLIDDQVKRFVEHLEKTGKLDNTIIIFTADHGDYAGDYGLMRKGVELPECLVRIPFIISGPGIAPCEDMRDDCVSLVDIFPTLCDALGAEIPYGVQGRSLWPMLTGSSYPAEEFRSIYSELGIGGLHYTEDERPKLHFDYDGPRFDELNSVTQSGNLKMVRMGKWKLMFDMMGRGQLYDLDADPGELNNLYDDPAHRQTRLEMVEELLKWTIRAEDDLPGANYTPKPAERNWYAAYRGSE